MVKHVAVRVVAIDSDDLRHLATRQETRTLLATTLLYFPISVSTFFARLCPNVAKYIQNFLHPFDATFRLRNNNKNIYMYIYALCISMTGRQRKKSGSLSPEISPVSAHGAPPKERRRLLAATREFRMLQSSQTVES